MHNQRHQAYFVKGRILDLDLAFDASRRMRDQSRRAVAAANRSGEIVVSRTSSADLVIPSTFIPVQFDQLSRLNIFE